MSDQQSIVHIAASDIVGGAAIAAYRLQQGLRAIGMNSQLLVSTKSSYGDNVYTCTSNKSILSRLEGMMRSAFAARKLRRYRGTAPATRDMFSSDRSVFPRRLTDCLPQADVYNLHWTAGFLDYGRFFGSLPEKTPMVWTLHDMYPFTGGCHYSRGCSRFTDRCGCCPALGSQRSDDPSTKSLLRKRNAMHDLDPATVRVVAPSRWLASEAKRSALLQRFDCQVIPNGVDCETFSPRSRRAAREVFGLPQEAKVAMIAAQSLTSYRKGLDLLSAAFRDDRDLADVVVFSVGSGQVRLESNNLHVGAGQIESERLLSFAYSAADVFVCPTREDNLPNVVLEAMACGTPVAAFDVGGVPDMVRPDRTGLLVPAEDVHGLGRAIAAVITDDELRRRLSKECRRTVLREYSLTGVAALYQALYEKLS